MKARLHNSAALPVRLSRGTSAPGGTSRIEPIKSRGSVLECGGIPPLSDEAGILPKRPACGTHSKTSRDGLDGFIRARGVSISAAIPPPTSTFSLQPSAFGERGVALIITLILLSIITFMAVTFLVVSRHASEQVTTVTQQAVAKEAADAAVQQAEARIVATMLGKGEGFDFGLMVSTNYQSPYYNTKVGRGAGVNITNVNYYDINGQPLTININNYLQMLNNLLILPRPPVFITTNPNPIYAPDFRYYLDLNQNGVFDPNNTNSVNPQIVVVDQFGQTNGTVGDPEWIGILEQPDQPHSRSNLFVARYCFLAQPIGNSLDINYIHNQAKQLGVSFDGFLRNQGVGSWEINLAGFLNGLQPNQWSYFHYDTNTPAPWGIGYEQSTGTAFQDAASILQYRYFYLNPNNGYNYLSSFAGAFSSAFNPPNPNFNLVDYYPSGPLMTTVWPNALNPIPLTQNFGRGWSGAGNQNNVFTPADFFTAIAPEIPASQFSARLFSLGANLGPNAFNEYTFYRMLAQMGMESAPEPATKLNLNYKNVDGYAASNFVSWAEDTNNPATIGNALEFFLHAGDSLLKSQPAIVSALPAISITNIPVYPVNYYTPSVHRMLQLAANIYDAANPKTNGFDYPSVFRPVFSAYDASGFTNIWISGYTEVGTDTSTNAPYNQPAYSLTGDTATIYGLITAGSNNLNIYNIPWVIGAKKYLPNFNQVSLGSYTALTRKLQIDKHGYLTNRAEWHTNVQ